MRIHTRFVGRPVSFIHSFIGSFVPLFIPSTIQMRAVLPLKIHSIRYTRWIHFWFGRIPERCVRMRTVCKQCDSYRKIQHRESERCMLSIAMCDFYTLTKNVSDRMAIMRHNAHRVFRSILIHSRRILVSVSSTKHR